MPFELNILVQLSAIPTEDEAIDLSNRVQEVTTNALLTTPGVSFNDLTVKNYGVIEWDDNTGAMSSVVRSSDQSTGVTTVPSEMYDELTTDTPDEPNENLRRAEQRRRNLLEDTPEVES